MSVTAPKGFRAAGVAAGLKSSGAADVAVVVNDADPAMASAAAVFTSNRFAAAPVQWSRSILKTAAGSAGLVGSVGSVSSSGTGSGASINGVPGAATSPIQAAATNSVPVAVVLNSGGANACTGPEGLADSKQTAAFAADRLGLAPEEVLVCSTGLIGLRLDMTKLLAGVDQAIDALSTGGGERAADAIRTTDTRPKLVQVTSPDGAYVIGGMAKGAGMLAPELATMLVVLTTDAIISTDDLQAALKQATSQTFDRVDSDGCMSTNDSVIVLASGASGQRPGRAEFTAGLTQACADLARQLVADAEGASHDIAITVTGADSEAAALAVARAIARSNLLKAAIFGNDPNWGRVLSAAGTVPSRLAPYLPGNVDVAINGVWVCRSGGLGEDRDLVDLTGRDVEIRLDLHSGSAEATIWTNDLTHDYVHENSAYAT